MLPSLLPSLDDGDDESIDDGDNDTVVDIFVISATAVDSIVVIVVVIVVVVVVVVVVAAVVVVASTVAFDEDEVDSTDSTLHVCTQFF